MYAARSNGTLLLFSFGVCPKDARNDVPLPILCKDAKQTCGDSASGNQVAKPAYCVMYRP